MPRSLPDPLFERALLPVADEVDASVVVVAPRAKSRLVGLLTGDTALSLVTDPPVPVLAVPHGEA